MKKYTLFHFAAGDFKAVERYLNEQADKGWELEKAGLFFARWKKSERKDLRWCVDLADPKQQREDRKEYADFCGEGGWELMALRGGMYLFKSMPGWDPLPVQTDPELERKNYNRYYVRNTILSAIGLLAIAALYVLMLLGMNTDPDYLLQTSKGEWHRHWLAVGILGALPLWGIWLVWKPLDFLRALISNRRGGIAEPPGAVMWLNCAVNVIGFLGAVLFFAGLFAESTVQAEFNVTGYLIPVVWSVGILIQMFTFEFELYRGEKKFLLRLSLLAGVLFVLTVAGRVALPYGEWSTNTFSYDRDTEGAMEQYALLEDAPVVRGEDLGIELNGEKVNYLDILREYTPVGERWEVEYTYWKEERHTFRCETYHSPSLWQAKLAEEQLVEEIRWWSDPSNRENKASYLIYDAPPQVELDEMELSWADCAWYGENDSASVLVVRVGTQVTRVIAPGQLNTEELLPVIEGRLCPK